MQMTPWSYRVNRRILAIALVLGGAICGDCLAQDRGVADRLLEDLKNEATADAKTATEESAPRTWHSVAEEMRRISAQIPQSASASGTLAAQGAIIDELTRLLEQAKDQGGSIRGSAKSQDGETQQNNGLRGGNRDRGNEQPGTTGQGPATKAGMANQKTPAGGDGASAGGNDGLVRRAWGQLPGRVRERLQSGAPEKFHQKYQSATEDYFRKLAETEQRP
jgi:hypothetical protein